MPVHFFLTPSLFVSIVGFLELVPEGEQTKEEPERTVPSGKGCPGPPGRWEEHVMTKVCVLGAAAIFVAAIMNLSKEHRMTTVYVIGGIVSAGLFVYLMVALLKPEVYS